VFVETQFQAQPRFYARWLAAIFLHLYRHALTGAWRGVVVYPARSTEQQLPQAYRPLAEAGLLHRGFLEDLLDTPPATFGARLARLVVLDEAEAAVEARALAASTTTAPGRFDLLDLIETILVYKFPSLTRAEIRAMLHLPDTDLKQTQFYKEVFAEGRLEGRQEGRLEGRQEGREEGREEGEQRGEIRLLLRLIAHRFGPPEPGVPEHIARLSAAQRAALSEALLDFDTAADLSTWLREHQPPTD
jgi:predicted transposase/invertase (TIGR01784 family)